MNEYTLAEIEVGMKAVFHKTITKKMEDAFRVISGDENPLHKDDTFALEISNGKFQGHAAFGMLTLFNRCRNVFAGKIQFDS